MCSSQKRLAVLDSQEPDDLAAEEPIFRENKERERSYSLIVRGISKAHTCPEDLRRLADGILRQRFRFFPPCDEFVDKVFYCLHVDGDMGILVFFSELVAELLFSACCDTAISPFFIAGKRFSLERNYKPTGEVEDFLAKPAVTGAVTGPVVASTFAYLTGVPEIWEDADKLESHFNGVLESEFPSSVVRSVHVFPGAAHIEFTSKAAIDRLFDRCEQDESPVTDIGQEVVLYSRVKLLPVWRAVSVLEDRRSDASTEENEVVLKETLEDAETLTSADIGELKRRSDVAPPPGKRVEVASSTGERVEDHEGRVDSGTTSALALLSPEKMMGNLHIDDSMRCVTPSPRAPGPRCRRLPEKVWGKPDQPDVHSILKSQFKLRQCSLVVGGLSRESFDSERVACHFSSMLRKLQLCDAAEVSWRSPDEAMVSLVSERAVDRLMDNYIQFPEEFYLNGKSVFWLSRPEGYHRPGAVYRKGNPSTSDKAIIFNGLSSHWHREQIKRALEEAVERMLMKHGVLEKGKPLFKSFTNLQSMAVITLDDLVANALTSSCVGLTVARRPLAFYTSRDQVTLFVAELPETAPLSRLGQVLATGLAKMGVDHRSAIERMEYSGPGVVRVTLRAEAAANALMTAYINFTQDFCAWDMPLVILRHEDYVRPGATYRKNKDRRTDQRLELWQVFVAGIYPGLNPIPLMGAVSELVERTLAGDGVLEEHQRPFKRFYWQKGSDFASLVVEEDVAAKLVDAKGLTLAGYCISFFGATIFREEEPPGTGGTIFREEEPEAPGTGGTIFREEEHRTGGWIEAEEED